MRERQLPRAIRNEVTSYYADIWVSNAGQHPTNTVVGIACETNAGHMGNEVLQLPAVAV